MKRIEIITNKSIEADVIELLMECGYGESFSYIPQVFGRGKKGRREASAIWPEENVIFIIYISDTEQEKIVNGLKQLKVEFDQEGLQCFVTSNVDKLV